MTKKISLLFFTVFSIFLIVSCNDSPTDLGANFLGQDGVEVLKLDSSVDSIAQRSYSFKNVFNLGNSTTLLLGKTDNITSHILLKFVILIPDSIQDEITANNLIVQDTYIEFVKNYSFGDSNATFDYGAFKVNDKWSSTTFTSDSFATLSYENIDLSSDRVADNDSVYSFHLASSIASSWLKNSLDSTLESNNGILLSPTANSQKVNGFTAFNTSGINDPRLRIVVQKPGEYVDTLIGYIASDVSVVLGEVPNVGPENLAIQSSLTAEAKLFFDLSAIPENVVINSAVLTLTVDSLKTKTGSNFTNTLTTFLLTDSSKNELNTNYVYTLKRSGETYTGEITNIVRAWNNNVTNQGLLIKSTVEFFGLEVFTVKGSNASMLSQRPRLEIVYSRGSNK